MQKTVQKENLGIEREKRQQWQQIWQDASYQKLLNQIEGRDQGTNWTCLQCGIAYKTPEQF